jgi:transposase
MESSPTTFDPAFLAAFRTGSLTPSQVEAVLPQDRGAVIFLLLQLSARLAAEVGTPAGGAHTPSGSLPPYSKPKTPSRGKKKPGAQKGHRGHSRAKPTRIDRHETHRCPVCPDCGGELHRTGRTRTRVVEDLPEDLKAEATEHTIHRDWCPGCKKQVEPQVPDALPRCTLGNRTLILTAWLFYGLATTLSQIVEVFNHHLRMKLTPGGLVQMWHRLGEVLLPWYEQIRSCCLDAGVLHADETGWRVEGQTWWLWCFSTADATYYLIDRSRGHPALDRFFAEEFDGVLVADFWAAYDAVGRLHQKCWPHLLRDLKEVDEGKDNGDDWPEFRKRLRRIYGDAIRLVAARTTLSKDAYDLRHAKLHARMTDLAVAAWTNPHARRLAKRLFKYGEYLLTFVEFEGVPPDNNQAEREIRPAVLMRKTSYGNMSERGAITRAVLMTIFRTLRRRGLDPLQILTESLRTAIATGQLPPLHEKNGSAG